MQESFYIKYDSQLCLRSKHSNQYVGIQTSTQVLKASYLPAYVDIYQTRPPTQRPDYTLKIKIVSRDLQKPQFVLDGSKVHLINAATDQYITCSSIGQIKFDKKSNISEDVNKHLYKASTWTVQLLRNQTKVIQTQQENITRYDEICFKSVHSTFLTLKGVTFELCSMKQLDNQKSVWNLVQANTPFIPQWMYKREFFSKFAQCNLNNLNYNQLLMPKQVRLLKTYPPQIQQTYLVQDLIDVMLGFQGVYIKRYKTANQFAIQPHLQQPSCTLSLKQLTQKILVLPIEYLKIESYVQTYGIQSGIINQAFCGALKDIIKDYKTHVIQLDEIASQGGLTLQKMLYFNLRIQKNTKAISSLVTEATNYKGGQLLTLFSKFLNQNTQQQIGILVRHLFQRILRIYVKTLSKWLYEGVIQDKYGQFMIMAQQKSQNRQWNYWEERYLIRQNMVPLIFAKQANEILVTGKYLNILKACGKLTQHPLNRQIDNHFSSYISLQNFSQPINNAYRWANQQMLDLVFNQCKFYDVLKSIKGFFFLEYGDLFVHFMDSAEEDLCILKKKTQIGHKGKIFSEAKIQNLFELLMRTSSANNDQFKEDITCRIQNTTIYDQMHRIKTLQPQKLSFDFSQKPFVKRDSKYVDFLTLQYQCKFPLTLIFNKKTMSKYQILFRYIFWCKFVQRQLNNIWLSLQQMKQINLPYLAPAYLLNQRMINFIKNFIYYLCYQVIQQNWLHFNEQLKKVKTLQDIITYHSDFLNKCIKQSLLSNSRLLTLITSQIGKAIQNFTNIKNMLNIITQNFRFQPLPPNPKNPSIIQQRKMYIQQFTKHAQQNLQQKDFRHIIQGDGQMFDDSIRKLLRQIYSIIGKQQNYLLNLVNRLDQEKFYNKRLFKGNQSVFN